MSATSILGDASAEPGAIVLGAVGSSPPPPPPPVTPQVLPPEVKQGPPMRGAPWATHLPIPLYAPSQPPPPAGTYPQIYPGEVKQGPPMPGAPWFHFAPTTIPAPGLKQTLPPIIPQVYPGEVHHGPPLHGAPWFSFFPLPAFPVQKNPTIPAKQVYPPEVTHGPGVPGAPWGHGGPVSPPVYPPPPPPAPTPRPQRGTKSALIPRVINPPMGPGGGTSDDGMGNGRGVDGGGSPLPDRTRQHTAKVSDLLNSLLRQNEILQISSKDYAIGAKFVESRDPTIDDDVTVGAVPGSQWINNLNNSVWINAANGAGSAIWVNIASGSGGSGLTGTFP